MAFIHPNFFPSKDCRDSARRVTTFGILVCVLQIYALPISNIPEINIPSSWAPLVKGTPVLAISTMLSMIVIYNYIVFIGQYIGEYALFNELDIELSVKELSKNIEELKYSKLLSVDEQVSLSKIENQRSVNYNISKLSSFLRFFSEVLLPSLLLAVSLYLEFFNILDLFLYLL